MELSLTITEVPTDATLTPVILNVDTRLSAFSSCAVAIAVGNVAIAYGGVPPLMRTSCAVPTPTLADGGVAVNAGPGGDVEVGLAVSFEQAPNNIQRPNANTRSTIERRTISTALLSVVNHPDPNTNSGRKASVPTP